MEEQSIDGKKIVQISTCVTGWNETHAASYLLTALCEDGQVYIYRHEQLDRELSEASDRVMGDRNSRAPLIYGGQWFRLSDTDSIPTDS